MSVADLLVTVRQLERADKFSLMQFLARDLAEEEQRLSQVQVAAQYPLWSQYDAFEAAQALAAFIQESKHEPT